MTSPWVKRATIIAEAQERIHMREATADLGDPIIADRRLGFAQCDECGRRFDLFDEQDAQEWAYGHDCE